MEDIVFWGFNLHAWITIVTVVSIFVVMARSRIPAEVAFLGALTVLLVTGVVTEEEGMAGFGTAVAIPAGILLYACLKFGFKSISGCDEERENTQETDSDLRTEERAPECI